MIPSEWLQHAPKPQPLPDGMKWHVFLSYRSVNRGWVLNLYDILTELKFRVFLDQYVLKPGDSLARVLESGLETSSAGILVWSNSAQDSEWVRNEYDTMITRATNDKSFYFVPIRIDNTKLPTFANTKLFLDFTEYPDGPNGGDLLRLVHGILGLSLDQDAVRFAYEQDEAAAIAGAKIIAAIRNDRPDRLLQLFNEGGLPWKTTTSLGCKAVEGLIKLGKQDEALEVLSNIIKTFPHAIRPKQLKALALARRGKGTDLEDAQDILGELYALNHLDPETLGIYGRTWMDRYKISGKIGDLRQSRNYYAEAFDRSPDDYYTGINAAAKSVLLGTDADLKEADSYAEKTQKVVGTDKWPGDYWKTATVAELFLIRKQYREAANMYREAVEIEPNSKGSHESTMNQATKLMDKLSTPEAERALVLLAFES